VYQVQHYATPAPPNPPNILQQAQCDPSANISATSDITVLSNRVQLANQFPVASADHTSPVMLDTVIGTYDLQLSDLCGTPVVWYSRRQNKVESITFCYEFDALRVATEKV
jgi:hypothetical protein